MRLKYRIKEYTFPFSPNLYSAQYKFLGMWVYINNVVTGNIRFKNSCYIYSFKEADDRIQLHKDNMERAKEWWDKSKKIYEL